MRAETEESWQERILRVLVHVQEHLDETLELNALAALAHCSPFHFHRVFRGMVGEGVHEHVRRLRLERAAYRLKFTDQSVTRVAFDAGYETLESFSRAFRKMFDVSPSGFRKQQQQVPYGDAPSGIHFHPQAQIAEFRPVTESALEVELETLEPFAVVFLRHVGPYDAVGEAWQKLMQFAGQEGLLRGPPTAVGIPFDDPEITPEGRIRYDASVTVSPDRPPARCARAGPSSEAPNDNGGA